MRRFPAFVVISALSAFIVHSGSVLAQRPDRDAIMASAAKSAFQKIKTEVDKNKDGKLSKAEFFAIYRDKRIAEKNYTTWDLNKDGFITEEEYVKAVVNIGNRRKR